MTNRVEQLLSPVLKSDSTSTYASYSSQIYFNKHSTGRSPIVTTDFNKLQSSAKTRLSPEAYDYAVGGAGTSSTVRANREVFDKIHIIPRMLQPVLPYRDLSTTLFGRRIAAPIIMAPVGVQRLFHPDGEIATAKVFGEHHLPFTLSTASSSSMVDVAEANGDGNPRWFQLYWPTEDELTISYLKRAQDNGYEVLVVTVDTWELAWRPKDLDRGYFPFINGIGTAIGLEDKIAQQSLGFSALDRSATAEQKMMASLYHVVTTSRGVSPVWENLKKLRDWWGDKPIVLKGIQSVEDAMLAVDHGMDGIIVSNHGGRQVDGAIASLEALVNIVDAVHGKLTIGFDSGIRCGADIFKALAIGADFVQVGRPIVWGLAHEGEVGTRHVLKSLLADFDLTVALSGCRGLVDINRQCIANRKQYLL